MRRYNQFAGFYKQPDGTTRYESTRWPVLPVQQTDQYIITKLLDRLDILAYDFYQDSTKWWVLARANNLPPGTFRIPAGTRLRIPFPLPESEFNFSIINSQF
jgi:hypothetical protein